MSLDYVLHMAGAYVRTPPGPRAARVRGALCAVGPSVMSGASTTVGAALFLLGCTVTFFTKFGVFIAWTLSMSLLQAGSDVKRILAEQVFRCVLYRCTPRHPPHSATVLAT
jgi:hypothetical protein